MLLMWLGEQVTEQSVGNGISLLITVGIVSTLPGIIANGILMVPVGFVISGTLLFVLAARGFGSKAWVKNAIIGLIIAVATYAFFNYGLGLGLPRGILPV